MLNADLETLDSMYGQDHLKLEISFPDDYPTSPFFIRVVTPRCMMYTGHVTAGGSVCLEMLTNGGTTNSWKPSFCVSGIMPQIKFNLIHAERVWVDTLKGGGQAGPLRIDFASPLREYSEKEARAAFTRTEQNHRVVGW